MQRFEYSHFNCHECKKPKPRSKLDKQFKNRMQCTDCTTANIQRRELYAGHACVGVPARLYAGASL